MKVVTSRSEFAAARREMRSPIGLVPTMGALHAGHAALLRGAGEACDSVVATVFVNPMQFGPGEDLARYPRSLERDLDMCRAAGVELVWAPSVGDVYPHGDAMVTVDPGALGSELEGLVRPTHFAGVLTVVAKLLNLVRPDQAFFGEKDYQQLTLIRRMAADLDLGVQISGLPTVREPDGLALSSRNVYLSTDERRQALALSQALAAGREAADGGADAVVAAARAVLDAEPRIHVDYLELRSPELGPPPETGDARLLVAARVGSTRLIDNVGVTV
ncbi:MAG TPA: pantoate--beta-alanine ligase [Jatrophihabitantaceae bacterium]|jgi:pantoate--beta-alanine ligase|nr:pantoate--beta-alanine ligase [Jatrophihabitantaceae bacterium]